MKKTLFTGAMVIVALAFSLVSCNQGNNLPDGYESNGNGMVYKYLSHGNGETTPAEGDYVTIQMTYTDGDTLLFDSKTLGYPMQLPMIKPTFKGDVYDALSMMIEGDSLTVMCNADSVFLKLFRMPSVPPEVDSIENIYFTLKLDKIQTPEQVQAEKDEAMQMAAENESVAREAFLAEKYPDAKPTESGMYFIQEKKGKGKKAEAGKKVKVHYTGMFLDGSKFDSSVDRGEPIEFTLGQGQVIPGWDEGIGMMRVGDKAVLVIPSNLAYGAGGRGSIPPSSTLVFEVELMGVE